MEGISYAIWFMQLEALQLLAQARRKGILRTVLAKRFGMDAGKFQYVVKVCSSCHMLYTRAIVSGTQNLKNWPCQT